MTRKMNSTRPYLGAVTMELLIIGGYISGIQMRSGAVILRGIENMRRRERSRDR